MTPEPAGIFTEGDLVAKIEAVGLKPSKACIKVDRLLPQLTRDELEKLYYQMTFDESRS